MIHTFEIIIKLNKKELNAIFQAFPDLQAKFLEKINCLTNCFTVKKIEIRGHRQSGIKKLSLHYWKGDVYAILQVEPQVMIEKRLTINLFDPTQANYKKLAELFTENMKALVGDIKSLVKLDGWNCGRMDCTSNLKFDSKEEKDLFLSLVWSTSKHVKRKRIYKKDISPKDQSIAERNTTTKILIYDKEKQVATYKKLECKELVRLLDEAKNVVRFEVQCYRPKIQQIKKTEEFPYRGIHFYLNEELSNNIFIKGYEQVVGKGDFYKINRARTVVKNSSYSKKVKKIMEYLLSLFANYRDYDSVKEKFLEGVEINGKVFKFGKATFSNYLKRFQELNLNPITIPRSEKISYLRNPIYQMYKEEKGEIYMKNSVNVSNSKEVTNLNQKMKMHRAHDSERLLKNMPVDWYKKKGSEKNQMPQTVKDSLDNNNPEVKPISTESASEDKFNDTDLQNMKARNEETEEDIEEPLQLVKEIWGNNDPGMKPISTETVSEKNLTDTDLNHMKKKKEEVPEDIEELIITGLLKSSYLLSVVMAEIN